MFTRKVIEQGCSENELTAKEWLVQNAKQIQSAIEDKMPTVGCSVRAPRPVHFMLQDDLEKLGFTNLQGGEDYFFFYPVIREPEETEYQSEFFQKGFSARSVWNTFRKDYADQKDMLALQCQEEMQKEFFKRTGSIIVKPKRRSMYLFLDDVVAMIRAGNAYRAEISATGQIAIHDPCHLAFNERAWRLLLKQ